MPRSAFLFASAATLCLCPLRPALAVPPDSLWLRAVAAVAAADSVIPGLVRFEMEFLDGEGRAEETSEQSIRISLDEAGELRTEVVRSAKNGVEVPLESGDGGEDGRESRSTKRDGGGRSLSFGSSDHPFATVDPDSIDLAPLAATRTIDARPCVGYEFVRTRPGGKMVGTAWLDSRSGIPLEFEMRPDPLPKRVKRLVIVSRCDSPDSLGWRILESRIQGEGGFLFLKKRFRSILRFEEHWRLDRPRPALR